ncbi:MAG: zf-HC2 domain-containing protein [Planctomycetes bacterium]|nr:zf-HC2 domain-containing protein [Planctomycetota bacterium]
MNCNHCRYELSQCLDGRLPSGRRALVMEHVAQCRGCETFWNELQAAQQLVLQLPRERVGEHFREQLWERIRAGEGTPEAVFHEPVPFTVKIRYAMTGAAAAAVVLLGVLALRSDATPQKADLVADSATPNGLRPRVHDGPSDDFLRLDHNPLLASTVRLTPDVVALEAARQLEQRYATLRHTLGKLQDHNLDGEVAVEQALDNANEFESLGGLLLEMSDRRRLVFVEQEVGTDLRLAVGLLGQTKLLRRDRDSVTEVVGRALQSRRLSNLSGMISLVPTDPREEREVLVRLSTLRPEVFPKLFIVLGTDDDMHDLGIGSSTFAMDDACGTSWVAPRSMVEARENLIRWARSRR